MAKSKEVKGMPFERVFTTQGISPYDMFHYDLRTSVIKNPAGDTVFELKNVEVPSDWSQVATDILAQKYFRKAGVPQPDGTLGCETSVKQVVHRLANCWKIWGERYNYFKSSKDADIFYDEIVYTLLAQIAAPNSPQWFNTGLYESYGISGEAQGHWYVDPDTQVSMQSDSAYKRAQASACFILSVKDDLVNDGGIMDLVVREARIFKHGSGAGTNYSTIRGAGEKLSGGGSSSGLMSFLRVGDRSAGAIKSGGTTRRSARMVILDADHPEILEFINWKKSEEKKVAALIAAGYSSDYEGEAYATVSGQNSNNSVRLTDEFMKAVREDADWRVTARSTGAVMKTYKARYLWEQIAEAAHACADPGLQFHTTINDWHTSPKGGEIRGSNPCVTGDTLVTTDKGLERIDSLVGQSRKVKGLDGNFHPVTKIFSTGEKEVFRLETKSGYHVNLTADHLVYTTNRGDVKACELTDTDKIALSTGYFGVEETIGKDLALFIGLLIGDGCITNDKLSKNKTVFLTIGDKEKPVADWAFNYLETVLKPKYCVRPSNSNLSHVGSTYRMSSCAERLLDILSSYAVLDEGSLFKSIKDICFTLTQEEQRHLLRGLFTTDGTVLNHGLKSQYVALDSCSLLLIEQVQTMLLNFDIKSKIYKNRRNGKTSAILPDGKGGSKEYAVSEMYSLRITKSNRFTFEQRVGFMLESSKYSKLKAMNEAVKAYSDVLTDTKVSFTSLGVQQVYDLTEPETSHFVCNNIITHNCSEFVYLDDTACNLASINLRKLSLDGINKFNIHAFEHSCRLWTTVLEISVLMSHYPSKIIAEKSYQYRPLGLGYANLGSLLMVSGIPYDSEEATGIAGALTAIMTGTAYAASAELASVVGAFPKYEENKEAMLRVIKNHREATYGTPAYKGLSTPVVPINMTCPDNLRDAAQDAWDKALWHGQEHGYRNAQTTVLAPTGCLVGNSLVITDRGLIRLGTIGNTNGDSWQDLELSVLTDTGVKQATKFYINGVAETRKITTSCGYAVQGTLQHRVKVFNPMSKLLEWRYFSDIKHGDKIALSLGRLIGSPSCVKLPPIEELHWNSDFNTVVPSEMSADLAELIGYFMGDGSLHSKQLRFAVTEIDEDVVGRLCQLSQALFNIKATFELKVGCWEVCITSVHLVRWWQACGFDKLKPSTTHSGKGYTPRVPDAILYSNDGVIYSAFLRGLFEADGTSALQGYASLSTASEAFASDIRNIMLSLGIPTTTKHDVSQWGQSTIYNIRLLNKSYLIPFNERIGFIGSRKRLSSLGSSFGEQAARRDYVYVSDEVLNELLPLVPELKNAVSLSKKRHEGFITRSSALSILSATNDSRIIEALSFFYDEVDSNEDGGEQLTYDISVPENVTYIANGFVSHNTIGLLMDCDTTGVEPDFAIVKFKKLSGGGYFKIINQAIPNALKTLGYSVKESDDIVAYVLGHGSLENAPRINTASLLAAGLTRSDIEKIAPQLVSAFELGFLFNHYNLGEDIMQRLGIPAEKYTKPDFNFLHAIGFTHKEIEAANEYVCGTMTLEGAPHLKLEHYPVFDCANKCGKKGERFIHQNGHIRMMAAAQPFISGAISKTINLPNEATVQDIIDAHQLSWELGLKAISIYRDGSKLSQPLSTKSETKEEKDEPVTLSVNVEELTNVGLYKRILQDVNKLVESNDVEFLAKIASLINRKPLPAKRFGWTQKARIDGQTIFLRTGEYPDGTLGEIFIDMHKEGATLRAMLNCFAISVSIGLQHGVPLEEYIERFAFTSFAPSGFVEHDNIKSAKSILDFIFRLLAYEYLDREDMVHVKTPKEVKEVKTPTYSVTVPTSATNLSVSEQVIETSKEGTNAYLSTMMGDAPACNVCGHITVRNGTCYRCLNCGNSMGCS